MLQSRLFQQRVLHEGLLRTGGDRCLGLLTIDVHSILFDCTESLPSSDVGVKEEEETIVAAGSTFNLAEYFKNWDGSAPKLDVVVLQRQ